MRTTTKALKTGLGLLPATVAILAFPAAAQSAYLVPPGNSAATQYTEAVPTASGPKAGNPGHGQSRSPHKVLGIRNTEKLDAHGSEGQAVAEIAAETAPSTVGTSAPEAGSAEPQQEGSRGAGHGGSKGASPNAGAAGDASDGTSSAKTSPPSQQTSAGSSGLGEVIDQATGSSSSGQLGVLLPLIIVAALAWSVAFFLRQRKRPTE